MCYAAQPHGKLPMLKINFFLRIRNQELFLVVLLESEKQHWLKTCGFFSHSTYVPQISESFLAHIGLKASAFEDFLGKTAQNLCLMQNQ